MRNMTFLTISLLEIIISFNINGLPENTFLVSFDIVNIFPNIERCSGIKNCFRQQTGKKPSAEGIINRLKICLCDNNSEYDEDCLLQTNRTATRN